MIASKVVKGAAGELPQAGELLAVEAIDRTGLIVTSEGAFVRIFKVVPPNPLLMSAEERARTANTFQRLVSQLKAEETLQIYIDARPVNLAELLATCRREVEASAGPVPAREQSQASPMALAQWRLYAAMEESLRLHADEQAATEVSAYVVVPFMPRQTVARAALAWVLRGRLPTVPLERPLQAHRRALREHLAHVDVLRSELEAEGCPPTCSTASRWSVCCGPASTRPRLTRAGVRSARRSRCSANSTRRTIATSPARRRSG
jgi:hypothetical protein